MSGTVPITDRNTAPELGAGIDLYSSQIRLDDWSYNDMYIYGGYLLTGGKLDDNTPWQGINLLFGELPKNADEPLVGIIGKARRSDEMLQLLSTLPIGCPVEVSCDLRGKVIGINVIKTA